MTKQKMRLPDLSMAARTKSMNHRCLFNAMRMLQRPVIWLVGKISHKKPICSQVSAGTIEGFSSCYNVCLSLSLSLSAQ